VRVDSHAYTENPRFTGSAADIFGGQNEVLEKDIYAAKPPAYRAACFTGTTDPPHSVCVAARWAKRGSFEWARTSKHTIDGRRGTMRQIDSVLPPKLRVWGAGWRGY
jgi:hypothetical protein